MLWAEGKSLARHAAATCSDNYIHLFEDYDPDAASVTAEQRIRKARNHAGQLSIQEPVT